MIVTLGLIAVTCLVSYFSFQNPALLHRLILWPPAIAKAREYERLLTSGFIHADGTHLLFNMVTLYFFGTLMDPKFVRHIGEVGYLAFYLGGIVIASLPSYFEHRNDENYRTLGASGAVSAVLFAFILVQPWATIYVFFLPVPAVIYAVIYTVYSIYMNNRRSDNINHSAHLWGAAYGIAFYVAMEPNALALFVDRLSHPAYRF